MENAANSSTSPEAMQTAQGSITEATGPAMMRPGFTSLEKANATLNGNTIPENELATNSLDGKAGLLGQTPQTEEGVDTPIEIHRDETEPESAKPPEADDPHPHDASDHAADHENMYQFTDAPLGDVSQGIITKGPTEGILSDTPPDSADDKMEKKEEEKTMKPAEEKPAEKERVEPPSEIDRAIKAIEDQKAATIIAFDKKLEILREAKALAAAELDKAA